MNKLHQKFIEYSPYIDEIRQRVLKVAAVFGVSFIVGFFATVPVFKFIGSFFIIKNVTIVTVSPFQFVDLAMNTGIAIGLICSLPILVYQIYAFLREGLTFKEKIKLISYAPSILVLFVFGFLYGFFTLYSTFNAIAQINLTVGMQNYWDISKLISEILITSALLGLIFEFPLVLSALIRMNLFDIRYLRARRRHAIAIIFIGTSLLPPTDGVSLLIMVVPLILLYELTIFLNRNTQVVHV